MALSEAPTCGGTGLFTHAGRMTCVTPQAHAPQHVRVRQGTAQRALA